VGNYVVAMTDSIKADSLQRKRVVVAGSALCNKRGGTDDQKELR
jgi:hypothetical protein